MTGPGGVSSTVIRVPDRERVSAVTDSTPAGKQCTKCGKVKPIEEFSPDHRRLDGHVSRCKSCAGAYRDAHRDEALAYQARYRESHHEDKLEYQHLYDAANSEKRRQYYDDHRDRYRTLKLRRERNLRADVFRRYGEMCACCGTTEDLTIDHINGGGNKHREAIGLGARAAGIPFYRWLYRMYFPAGYQTLCRRCNTSKGKGADSRCDLVHGTDDAARLTSAMGQSSSSVSSGAASGSLTEPVAAASPARTVTAGISSCRWSS